MQTQVLRSGSTVLDVCAAADLSDAAMHVLAGAPDARAFLGSLGRERAHEDAIAFLAHALPRREAVWWAWLCARDAAGEQPEQAALTSLESTKSWIAEPTDSNRRAAFAAAQVVGLASPIGLVGLAAFLCGDTLGPAAAPPSPAPPFAAAKAIAGCIHLAAVAADDTDIAVRYAELIERGLALADRIDLWTPQRPQKMAQVP